MRRCVGADADGSDRAGRVLLLARRRHPHRRSGSSLLRAVILATPRALFVATRAGNIMRFYRDESSVSPITRGSRVVGAGMRRHGASTVGPCALEIVRPTVPMPMTA